MFNCSTKYTFADVVVVVVLWYVVHVLYYIIESRRDLSSPSIHPARGGHGVDRWPEIQSKQLCPANVAWSLTTGVSKMC